MSSVYLKGILGKVYSDFKDTVNKIKEAFMAVHPMKRKKIEDSMSISHISEVSSPKERRPSKG